MCAEFSIQWGLLLRGSRIVIPQKLRRNLMLSRIHEGHQGISKCRERARHSVWWPGLSTELEELVKNCTECCKAQVQRAEPLIPSPLPDLPWQKVATDLFQWEKNWYVLVVDYYSRYIEIALLNRLTSAEVITRLKSIFARHGIPEIVVSDCGKQYMSEEFQEFANNYHFQHSTSSPYYPQSNGEAERAVRTVKSLLKKSKDPYLALLAYRTTPVLGGDYSPSQLLMSRTLRSTIPTTHTQRESRVPDPVKVQTKDRQRKLSQKSNHDTQKGARELPTLPHGSVVWMTDREEQATVQQQVAPRSLEVVTGEGFTYRRNRKDLLQLSAMRTENAENTSTTRDDKEHEKELVHVLSGLRSVKQSHLPSS